MRNDWLTHLLLTLSLAAATAGAGASIGMYKHQLAQDERMGEVYRRLGSLEQKASDQNKLNHVMYSILVGRSGRSK
jgi:hypothetical protein